MNILIRWRLFPKHAVCSKQTLENTEGAIKNTEGAIKNTEGAIKNTEGAIKNWQI